MEINTKVILEKSKRSLLLLTEQLDTVEIEAFQDFELKSSEFRTMVSFEKATSFLCKNDTPIIYNIELTDTEKRKKLLKAFESFSKLNKTKTKNENRLNHSKDNKRDSTTLYVGSSTSNFKSRLKDHLGVKKSVRTYAMHLSKWDDGMDYTIRIKTYKLSKTERIVVEIIEQQIWDQLQPVFGKRSGLK